MWFSVASREEANGCKSKERFKIFNIYSEETSSEGDCVETEIMKSKRDRKDEGWERRGILLEVRMEISQQLF